MGKLSFGQRQGQQASQKGGSEKRSFKYQESFDLDDIPPDQEISDSDMQKILAEFRGRGERYQYNEQHQSHFKIKHW